MRDFKGMKRQRGRNRSGGGGGGGGGKPSHNVNRAFDSNGPDNVKIRGHAQHIYEKYQQLARDASASGDRVLAENYLQHAEHYFRVLRSLQPNRPASEIMGRDALASGFDIDFEDESGGEAAEETTEASAENGEAAAQGQGQGVEERPERFERGERDRGEGRFERGDRERGDRERGDRDRDRGERRERRDRFEGRPPREERGGYGREERRERGEEPRAEEAPRDPMPVVEPEGSSVLRSQDGGVSQAPAFLQAPAAPAEEGEGRRPRTRSRRRPRSFEAGEGEAAPEGVSEAGEEG